MKSTIAIVLAMPAASNHISDIKADRVMDGVDLGLLVPASGDGAVTVPGWTTPIVPEPDPLEVCNVRTSGLGNPEDSNPCSIKIES